VWCWRRVEKITWGVHVKTENVLHRINEQMNALSTTKRRKANYITTFCIETSFYNKLFQKNRRDGKTRKNT